MEGKRNTLVILLIVFIITTVLLGGFIFYDKVLDNEHISKEEGSINKPSDDTKKLYHIEDGGKFEVYGKTSGENDEFIIRNNEVSFAYPVIDIDSEEIRNVNKEIADNYQEAYNTTFGNEADADSCIALKKDDKYFGGTHIFYNSYRISEGDNYLSIVIVGHQDTECAGGSKSYKGYVINKETNKLMSNKEILRLFGAENDEKLFIDEHNRDSETFGYDKINSIEDANILIYDNKLMISIVGNGEFLSQYNNGNLEQYD